MTSCATGDHSPAEHSSTSTVVYMTAAIPLEGTAGGVFRLTDGRLATLTVKDAAVGVEDSVKADVRSQLLGTGTAVLAGDMRALGVDDGLQAWAEED